MRLLRSSLFLVSVCVLLAGCSSSSSSAPDEAGSNPNGSWFDAGMPTIDGGSGADAATGVGATGSPDASASSTTDAGEDAGLDSAPPGDGRTVLIWVWQDYANTLGDVTSNASSFTHVSPALYQLNYDYASGAAQLLNTDDNFSGLSSTQIAQQIHAAGLKCIPMMYAGAGNSGTDQGIQNVLNDSPAGAQASFISSMVTEGVNKGYDGYNLDWEVQTTDDTYSAKYVSFLTAFKDALHAQGMVLTVDIAGWYIKQCTGSGGTGLVDVTAIGSAVDQAMIEDYSGAFTDTETSCPSSPPSSPSSQDCDDDFGGGLDVMCNVPPAVANIGLISTGSNAFADRALAAVGSYGFRNVSVWPDDSTFLNASGIPDGGTWYSLLAQFLAQK